MSNDELRLVKYLEKNWKDGNLVGIEGFRGLPGGYSKRTFAFDAVLDRAGDRTWLPLILRMDTEPVSAIMQNSREREHKLLNRLAEYTNVPVPRSYLAEMDLVHFGQPAMVLERVRGCTEASSLFKEGADPANARSIARQLCEKLAALHTADLEQLNHDGLFDDPRGAGISANSWDGYIASTLEYYLRNYSEIDFDALPVFYDSFLHMRRNKPRRLPLALLHGELNPANIIFDGGDLLSIVDWESAHVGDPREDLGWFRFIDSTSGTRFFEAVDHPGGFLGYYNSLTGFDISTAELDYFQIFAYHYAGAQPIASIKRRLTGQHRRLLQMYLMQVVVGGTMAITQLLGYPSTVLA